MVAALGKIMAPRTSDRNTAAKNPIVRNMALGGLVLGSLILYLKGLKGMRIMMFQLSGFYCKTDSQGDVHSARIFWIPSSFFVI